MRAVLAGVIGPAGADHVPHFLGDAVHVDREADPAIADEGETQLLFAHQPATAPAPATASVAQIGR